MGRRVELQFDAGQRFHANLLEEEAPETCARVWEALPIETELGHGIFTGMVLYVQTDKLYVRRVENPLVIGMAPGEIYLHTRLDNLNERRGGYQQIRIVCGPAIFFTSQNGYEPSNKFAHIVEGDLNELAAIWRAVHQRGVQRVRMRRVER